jgi:two-component system OmpR family response regulator
MNKVQILVVDDDPKLTGLVRIILERVGGFLVREENRSYAAVTTAREFHPDLIILDVDMPGRDGGDVAAELRTDPSFCNTPIMFLTSLAEKAGLHAGTQILAKPFDPQELVRTVCKLLPGKQF